MTTIAIVLIVGFFLFGYKKTNTPPLAEPAAQTANCFGSWDEKIWLGITNTIKSSSDDGATWSAAITVGDASSDVTALIPAFNNLFIQTEILRFKKVILCTRRPRSGRA